MYNQTTPGISNPNTYGYGQPPSYDNYQQPPSYSNYQQPPSYQQSPNYLNQQAMNMVPNNVIIVDANQQRAILPRNASHANFSTKICCPQCNNVGMTRATPVIGTCALLWCIFTFPLGLFCLCGDCCKDRDHNCQRCGASVGKWKKGC